MEQVADVAVDRGRVDLDDLGQPAAPRGAQGAADEAAHPIGADDRAGAELAGRGVDAHAVGLEDEIGDARSLDDAEPASPGLVGEGMV